MDLRNKMLEMLESTRVEETGEIPGNLLIFISLAKINNSNVYIVAEKDLHNSVRLFRSWDLNVHKVVCTLPQNFPRIDDVEIISSKNLLTDETPNKFFFLIMSDCTSDNINFFQAHFDKIPAAGKPNLFFIVDDSIKFAMKINSVGAHHTNSIAYYQSHKAKLMVLFDSLADEISKRTLYHYVESFVRDCVYKGEQNSSMRKYFFGGKYERLYKHLDGECWINCGANIGDTLFAYLSWNFKPKKIYAFEGNRKLYEQMLNNLSLLPPEKRELVEPINELITEQTDFEKILAGNKCTLLNADIEGAELNLLRTMKNIIQADRPVIAICVYHKDEDLVTLPQFLQANLKNYFYYLRKYNPVLGNLRRDNEIVLYGVPIERSILITPPPNYFNNP